MRREFTECLKKRKITRFRAGLKLIKKEIRSAFDDLEDARFGLAHRRFKWATIQSYYAMYHGARGLIYSEGYRERTHHCLKIALQALFVDSNRLDMSFLDAFSAAMRLRENADYRSDFSQKSAVLLFKSAESFLEKVNEILGRP